MSTITIYDLSRESALGVYGLFCPPDLTREDQIDGWLSSLPDRANALLSKEQHLIFENNHRIPVGEKGF